MHMLHVCRTKSGRKVLCRTITLSEMRKQIKGQMNQKIDMFSSVALPSPNTEKNHPK